MIPKMLHYIWIGPYVDSCPYVDSWCDVQKGYSLTKWTNDNPLTKKYLDECVELFGGMKTLEKVSMTYVGDLFRLLVLRDFGGVYIDHDFILLRDFSELLADKSLVLTFQYDPKKADDLIPFQKGETMVDIVAKGYGQTSYGAETVNNCFIAVTPHHPLISRAIELTLLNHFKPASEQYPMSDWGVGPSVMTDVIGELGMDVSKSLTVQQDDVAVYERNLLHPLHGLERQQVGKEQYEAQIQKLIDEKNAYAIHVHEHFGASRFIEKTLILFPEWYSTL